MKRLSLIFVGAALAACGSKTAVVPPTPACMLTITAINPATGPWDSSTLVNITGTNFTTTTTATVGTFALSSPALKNPTTITGGTTFPNDKMREGTTDDVILTDTSPSIAQPCTAKLAGGWTWHDVPQDLGITMQSPANGKADVSVLAQLVVTFNARIACPMNDWSNETDPAKCSANPGSITLGEPGHVSVDGTGMVATFKPDHPLGFKQNYMAKVLGGTAQNKPVRFDNGRGLVADATWNFTTRCDGCGNPWLGSISAASGFTKSTHYKLYTNTGEPSAVGPTTSSHYHLGSGFVEAAGH